MGVIDVGGVREGVRGCKVIEKEGEPAEVVSFSAKIEAELAELSKEERVEFLSSLGLESAGLDRLIRARISEGGYPGQPSHPICHGVGARAHEPPYAHQAGGGTIQRGMVLAIEPGIYWRGGGGLRVEDNFWITGAGNEKLCSYPDDFRLAGRCGAGALAREG